LEAALNINKYNAIKQRAKQEIPRYEFSIIRGIPIVVAFMENINHEN